MVRHVDLYGLTFQLFRVLHTPLSQTASSSRPFLVSRLSAFAHACARYFDLEVRLVELLTTFPARAPAPVLFTLESKMQTAPNTNAKTNIGLARVPTPHSTLHMHTGQPGIENREIENRELRIENRE